LALFGDAGCLAVVYDGVAGATQTIFKYTTLEDVMSEKVDRFTKKARRVLNLAQEEAKRLNHNYIGTEHLLLGMLGEESSLAAQVLLAQRVDLAAVRQRLIQTVGVGERPYAGKPALAPRAKRVIELAVEMARQLGHQYIGSEHLLLGLLQEGEGMGVKVLHEFITTDALVAQFIQTLSLHNVVPSDVRMKRVLAVLERQQDVLSTPGPLFERAPAARVFTALREAMMKMVSGEAVQEERSRLARDLHDSIKQQLFTISVSAAAVEERFDKDPAGARLALADVQRSAQAAMTELNAMLHQLSPTPLATIGLINALREQAQALSYRSGAEVTTAFGDLPAEERLPLGAQETIFRIAQEALANVARHARAQRVQLRLALTDVGNAVQLEVQDDGQGFDTEKTPGGMGLGNIQERTARLGGKAEISSTPGQGTTVRVRLPLLPEILSPSD
jgi:signal transduction histidine kinase